MTRNAMTVAPATPTGTQQPSTPASDIRILAVLCLAMFLAVINFAALAPFLPRVAGDLHTTIPLLGQVTTAVTLLSALRGLAIGPLADRYGPRRLVIGGIVAVAINLAGTGIAPSYGVLLTLAVVGGLGDAVLFGLPLALASSHFSGESQRRAIAWTSAALPLGTVAGVPLLTAIGGLVGLRPIFVATGVATLGAAWLATCWLPADSPRATRSHVPALLAAYRPVLADRSLTALYAVSGLRAVCWIGLLTYLGAFLTRERGLGSTGVAVAYLAAGGGVLIGTLAAATRLRRIPPRPLVAITTAAQGLLLTALFVLPLGVPTTLILLTPAALTGAVAFVGVATLLAAETTAGAGTTMVLNGSIFNLGSALGAALGGLLLAIGGFTALGLGLPLFALAASLVAWMSHQTPTPSRPNAAPPR